jgi:hypothetical protein
MNQDHRPGSAATTYPVEVYHCLRCDSDVPANEVHQSEWMPGRFGTFHTCGDYAHPGGWNG